MTTQSFAAAKWRTMALLAAVQVLAMSLWFVSAAILPEMRAEADLSAGVQAALSSAVQIGFVTGALTLAILGLPDRYDPRLVLAGSALIAAIANAALLVTPLGAPSQVLLRAITGVGLAGVYPVGMKIVVGWGLRDRAFLVGLLIGAITLGSASPHLIALYGGADWRGTVTAASLAATAAAGLALLTRLGPLHARAGAFDPGAIRLAWTERRARLAIIGYLGHMWELYAFWAWVATIAAAAYAAAGAAGDPERLARVTAFTAIALGGLACLPAGRIADRSGKARTAKWCMILSGAGALASAIAYGGPIWLSALCLAWWGVFIVPDSALFSSQVADAVPQERAGSLLTFQTALGFTLTAFTIQLTPLAAAAWGWPVTLALMAIGPAIGVEAMRRLARLEAPRGAADG